MGKEIRRMGVIYYFQKIDKNVNEQRYDPVSYEQWKMLRDIEPTKFLNDYDSYIKLKKEQYESEVERRRNCVLELKTIPYSLHQSDIDKTKQSVTEIQSSDMFEKWVDNELIDTILNYG